MSSKKLVMIGLLVVLLLGGGAFGVYTMKINASSYRAMALPVQGQSKEVCKEWVEKMEEIAAQEAFLKWVVEKSDYSSVMGVPEGEAQKDLSNRIKIKYNQQRSRIEIGLNGKRKNDDKLNQVAKVIHEGCVGTLAKAEPAFEEHLESVFAK